MNKRNNENNENKNNDNNKNSKELSYKEQFYKLVTFTSSVIIIASAGVLITDKICNPPLEDTQIEGQIISLSDVEKIDYDIINIKGYIKDYMNPNYQFTGEYGGGEYILDNGNYAQYTYTNDSNDEIVIEIRDTGNEKIFEKTIKLKDPLAMSINDIQMTKDNQVVLLIGARLDETKYTSNITTFDLEGNKLSQIEMQDVAYISNIDDLNNKIILTLDEDKEALTKLAKYDSENNKLFEKEFEHSIVRAYIEEDITIVFTANYDEKDNANITLYKLDNKGNEIFVKNKENPSTYLVNGITQLSDGNFIIRESEMIDSDMGVGENLKSITKIDSEFNIIWKQDINKVVESSDVLEKDNKYYLIFKEVYDVKEEKEDKIVKTLSINTFDASGEKLWNKYLGYNSGNKIDILNTAEIELETPPFIENNKIKINATIYENDESVGYVELLIDDNGDISK